LLYHWSKYLFIPISLAGDGAGPYERDETAE